MTSDNGATEELGQLLQFLKGMVSNNGITKEELEQRINEELKQQLPSTIDPLIIEHLGLEFRQKVTHPSREKYLWELYIVLYVAKQENYQVSIKYKSYISGMLNLFPPKEILRILNIAYRL